MAANLEISADTLATLNERLQTADFADVRREVFRCTGSVAKVNVLKHDKLRRVADFFGLARIESIEEDKQREHQKLLKRKFKKYILAREAAHAAEENAAAGADGGGAARADGVAEAKEAKEQAPLVGQGAVPDAGGAGAANAGDPAAVENAGNVAGGAVVANAGGPAANVNAGNGAGGAAAANVAAAINGGGGAAAANAAAPLENGGAGNGGAAVVNALRNGGSGALSLCDYRVTRFRELGLREDMSFAFAGRRSGFCVFNMYCYQRVFLRNVFTGEGGGGVNRN